MYVLTLGVCAGSVVAFLIGLQSGWSGWLLALLAVTAVVFFFVDFGDEYD